MKNYFQGWRRKLGCVALVLACLSLAGWFRSQTTSDSLNFYSPTHRRDSLVSVSSTLGWSRIEPPPHIANSPPAQFRMDWGSLSLAPAFGTQIVLGSPQDEIKWSFCGISRSEMNVMGAKFVFCRVSYWYLIVPFTALSLWLLLGNFARPKSSGDHPAAPENSPPELTTAEPVSHAAAT